MENSPRSSDFLLNGFPSKYLYMAMYKISLCCEYPTGMKKVHTEIIKRLSGPIIIEELDVEQCPVKMVLCPIVSRAGTDIEAALCRLSGEKPTIVLVLHHTFDPEYNAPNSSSYENNNVMLVDMLFHEDSGLLKCSKNDEAITKARNFLKKYTQQIFVPDKRVLRKVCLTAFVLMGSWIVYRKWKGSPVFPTQWGSFSFRHTFRPKHFICF